MRLPEETELLPYATGFPPGERWLVLAPHPDDETFGLGATLAQASARGLAVRTVVLTGGEAQGASQRRREEARAALQALGAGEPVFWDFVDRRVGQALPRLVRALRRELETERFEAVFAPHASDLHPDHRACALALQRALRRQLLVGRRRGLPGWVVFYEIGVPLWPNLLVDADPGWEAKERAFACYASQLAVRPYHAVAAGLGAFRSLTVAGPAHVEAFQVHRAWRVALRTFRWLQRQALGPLPPPVRR